MKKILLSSALFLTSLLFAQVPQGVSYQAIALNGSGNAVVSSNVGLRLSVLNTSATGTVAYSETHTKTTNAQGLFNLVIGQGTPISGTFAGINWATGSKFLKVEMDAAGGTNYALVGTTQLLSVPYAMAAGTLAGTSSGSTLADLVQESQYTNFGFIDFGSDTAYVYNATTGAWTNQQFSASGSPELVSTEGNFAFIDFGSDTAYAFSAATGTWVSQPFSSTGSPELFISGANFGFIDFGSDKAYVFNTRTGTWSNQQFSASGSPELVGVDGAFGFIDFGSDKAYAFSPKTGAWHNQQFSASGSPTLVVGIGSFAFLDFGTDKAYVFNPANGTWVSQQFSSSGSPELSPSNN
ncbi:NHL repeat-containing protein [Flavobacterium selenitireducens]|uniref:hypothetical protein n=1 Tax=Flavobacterium selenitireducens TaxID=2722704 RepID=UPI00168B0BC9|nr:hypothetical protein [Flavobacterium selenitireducens]MBD3583581.1 hypothetical protein [Flavobacterium selenitireducens]